LICIPELLLKSSPDPSKEGELGIDIEKILEPIVSVSLNLDSRYPSASELKMGRMLPPMRPEASGSSTSFGFFLTYGFELCCNRNQ
jgi:hypothetical protein